MNMKELQIKALEEIKETLASIDEKQDSIFREELFSSKRIFCAASGRSKMILSAFAMRLMHMGYDVYIIGDITTPGIKEGDTLLLLSGSGETGSLVTMADKAQSLDARVLLVTSNGKSSLAKMSTYVVLHSINKLYDGKKSIQPGANLFEQSALIYLDLLIAEYMNARGLTNDDLMKNHANLE